MMALGPMTAEDGIADSITVQLNFLPMVTVPSICTCVHQHRPSSDIRGPYHHCESSKCPVSVSGAIYIART